MKVSSLFQLRNLITPREKKPANDSRQAEMEGFGLRNIFEGARVRYDLLGFGPLPGCDDQAR